MSQIVFLCNQLAAPVTTSSTTWRTRFTNELLKWLSTLLPPHPISCAIPFHNTVHRNRNTGTTIRRNAVRSVPRTRSSYTVTSLRITPPHPPHLISLQTRVHRSSHVPPQESRRMASSAGLSTCNTREDPRVLLRPRVSRAGYDGRRWTQWKRRRAGSFHAGDGPERPARELLADIWAGHSEEVSAKSHSCGQRTLGDIWRATRCVYNCSCMLQGRSRGRSTQSGSNGPDHEYS